MANEKCSVVGRNNENGYVENIKGYNPSRLLTSINILGGGYLTILLRRYFAFK